MTQNRPEHRTRTAARGLSATTILCDGRLISDEVNAHKDNRPYKKNAALTLCYRDKLNRYTVSIEPSDFQAILEVMFEVDDKATHLAISDALYAAAYPEKAAGPRLDNG